MQSCFHPGRSFHALQFNLSTQASRQPLSVAVMNLACEN